MLIFWATQFRPLVCIRTRKKKRLGQNAYDAGYMGGVGYYRKFLRDLSERVRPITSFLRKGVKFESTPAMEAIVREIITELAAPPFLVFPDGDTVADGSHPFHVYCDAFADHFGASLEQDGSVLPIAYISRATLDSGKHWTPLDVKAGNIVWAIKSFRGYLGGTKFCIFSDFNVLELIDKVGDHNA